MDTLEIPKNQKEINKRRVLCLLSTLRGSVPYNREFGIDTNIDASLPAEAQRTFALAVQEIAKYVPDVRVTNGYVKTALDGGARVYVKLEDR